MAAPLVTADTSVVIPLLSPWHEAHRSVLAPARSVSRLPTHVLFETVVSLSRLPQGLSTTPTQVLAALRSRFRGDALTLDTEQAWAPLDAVADAGLSGGQVYDAIVAVTAKTAGAKLLSLDRRAERTYRAIGVDFELLD